jgi:hypothetical protein
MMLRLSALRLLFINIIVGLRRQNPRLTQPTWLKVCNSGRISVSTRERGNEVKKFGPLSPKLKKKIKSALVEDLEKWTDRLFEAQSLEELLG